ncbi:MAG: CBS domain-containing protein [Roseiarcus sp.]|uniref:CBS domain-containing protein n=1 Tax=Roseiarcus sp. TaxID=1969460 RepID=UPI003C1901DB
MRDAQLIASELMTHGVITVQADATVQDAARLMLESGVRAAPVVDSAGKPIGMVSDGDLLGRRTEDYRREWWLEMLAGAAVLSPSDAAGLRRVSDVMSAPLIFVDPGTPADEIAALLHWRRIKRLPVVRDGRLVGIVSRTDLLAVVEQLDKLSRTKSRHAPGLLRFLESLAGGASLRGGVASSGAASAATREGQSRISADAFRSESRAAERAAIERAAAEEVAELEVRRREAREILRRHLSEASWRRLLDRAEAAARRGDKEFLLHRFSSDLCSDGGRMINAAESGWETTLRGEPAEVVERWRYELKPKGFRLVARIVSYVDGVLGDVGLFLSWND